MPFVDISPDDPAWGAIQRVGVTGILKGVGKSEGWENKMYFYPDSLSTQEDIDRLSIYFSISMDKLYFSNGSEKIYCNMVENFIILDKKEWNRNSITFEEAMKRKMNKIWIDEFKREYHPKDFIARRDLAVLIEKYMKKIFDLPVNLNGE